MGENSSDSGCLNGIYAYTDIHRKSQRSVSTSERRLIDRLLSSESDRVSRDGCDADFSIARACRGLFTVVMRLAIVLELFCGGRFAGTHMTETSQRSKQDWLLAGRSFLFLFFRRGGSDLPSGLDPDADADLRQYDLRHRHGACPRSWRDWRSAVICSARSPTAAKTISCCMAFSKRGSAFTDFLVPWLFAMAQKVYGPIFGLNETYPFLFNLVLVLSLLCLAGVSDHADGRDFAGAEPLFRAQLRAVRPARRRPLRHQHAGRGDRLRRRRIFLHPDARHAHHGLRRRRRSIWLSPR